MTNDIQKTEKWGLLNGKILQELSGIIASLRYGDIVIKVHDSRIIQVEKTEKTRYDNYRGLEQGSGI
ncbi:MAG TPA: YezD family protein [Candidatus Omnitrophota bacterium]|nr:YezD family protein [Candidatus Omnitrophota bacterium]HRY86061.1 YezD family protein [Candidatus Omnitrophota bacterium]